MRGVGGRGVYFGVAGADHGTVLHSIATEAVNKVPLDLPPPVTVVPQVDVPVLALCSTLMYQIKIESMAFSLVVSCLQSQEREVMGVVQRHKSSHSEGGAGDNGLQLRGFSDHLGTRW